MHLVYRWLEFSLNLTEQPILLVQRFLLGCDNKKKKRKEKNSMSVGEKYSLTNDILMSVFLVRGNWEVCKSYVARGARLISKGTASKWYVLAVKSGQFRFCGRAIVLETS